MIVTAHGKAAVSPSGSQGFGRNRMQQAMGWVELEEGQGARRETEAPRFCLADVMFACTCVCVCVCIYVHVCVSMSVCVCIDQKTNLKCPLPFQKGSLINWSLPSKLGQLAQKLQGSSCLFLSYMDFKPSPTDTVVLNKASGI